MKASQNILILTIAAPLWGILAIAILSEGAPSLDDRVAGLEAFFREGQTFIAFHLLRGLGAPGLVASAAIDAGAAKVEKTERCTVSDLAVKDGVVSFRRVCEALPPEKRNEVADFARFLLTRQDDERWEQLLAYPGPRPKLEAFLRESAKE